MILVANNSGSKNAIYYARRENIPLLIAALYDSHKIRLSIKRPFNDEDETKLFDDIAKCIKNADDVKSYEQFCVEAGLAERYLVPNTKDEGLQNAFLQELFDGNLFRVKHIMEIPDIDLSTADCYITICFDN